MRKSIGPGVLLIALAATLLLENGFAQAPRQPDGWGTSTSVEHPATDPRSTYEKLLPLAEAGDPDVQNMLGFMYFYGEGVGLDYERAHFWFHEAAEQGDSLAQRNLGLFHSRTWKRIPEDFFDPVEANFWLSLNAAGSPGGSKIAASSYHAFLNSVERDGEGKIQHDAESGQEIYLTFCAGCHGFEGMAQFPRATSLLDGEGLDKSDAELLATILDGRESMPAWRGTISEDQARSVLSYMRERSRTQESVNESSRVTGALSPQPEEQGENLYLKFCGGCHGFNGISYYVNSPSFALRQRMYKSDAELAHSIAKGFGIMPSWEYMLRAEQIDSLVRFIRTLAPAYESGIDHDIRVTPELYFLFNPHGESEESWHIRRDE